MPRFAGMQEVSGAAAAIRLLEGQLGYGRYRAVTKQGCRQTQIFDAVCRCWIADQLQAPQWPLMGQVVRIMSSRTFALQVPPPLEGGANQQSVDAGLASRSEGETADAPLLAFTTLPSPMFTARLDDAGQG